MAKATRREVDGQTHHPPKTVEQQSEDSFPTSDPPSYSGGSVGAPVERKTDPKTIPKAPAHKRRGDKS